MLRKIISGFKQKSVGNHFSNEDMVFELRRSIDKHVIICCAPKSGSTWLSAMLSAYLEWNEERLVPMYGYREQELYMNRVFENNIKGKLFSPQQHLKYSEYTEMIFKAMNTKVVLQVRNIYDIIQSFKDHMENESVVFPSAYMSSRFWSALSEEMKYDYIVEMVVPWYISFYVGWVDSAYFRSGNVKVVSYEDLLIDKTEQIRAILDFVGEPYDEMRYENSMSKIAKARTRKNRGVAGRGAELSDVLKLKVKSYSRFYEGIDFSPLGL